MEHLVNMEQRRLMLIVNPIAGTVRRHNAEAYVMRKATALGYEVEVRHTRYAGHAAELAREAVADGYYCVLACGGDGTVNEIASGVRDSKVIMGIIPLGSGNGLARHLGIPLTVSGAMRVVAEDRVLEADYGTANGRPFFCTFGLGFDARVTDRFNNCKHKGRGLKNYLLTILEEIVRYKSERYTIAADGRVLTEDALMVACCNASQYGNNAYIAPRASIKDGLLDISLVHKGNLVEAALAGMDILTGLVGSTAHTSTFRTDSVTIIRKEEGPAHFDGESAMMPARIDVECHRGGLRLFSTSRKSRLRVFMAPEIPIISPMVLSVKDLAYKIRNLFR